MSITENIFIIDTCFQDDAIFEAGMIVCSVSPVPDGTPSSDFLQSLIAAAATAGKLFRLCDRTCFPFDGQLVMAVTNTNCAKLYYLVY